jgi:hypothetical protein
MSWGRDTTVTTPPDQLLLYGITSMVELEHQRSGEVGGGATGTPPPRDRFSSAA